MSRLQSKITIVTGSSSGLGRAIALAFASEGAGLVVCADLHPIARGTDFGAEEPGVPTHEVIQKRFGEGKAIFVRTDVSVSADVEDLVKKAVEIGGRLDVIANNAGVGVPENNGLVHEMEDEVWDWTMRINSRSAFLGCKYACAQFLNQEPHSSGHRGWIINTASIVGLVGQKIGAAYCASKGAVVLLTKSVALGYAKHKIHCNAICPGHLRTPMTQNQYQDPAQREAVSAMTPWGDEFGSPQDVARGVVFLASEDAAYITGVSLPIDGGYLAQ